MGTEGRKWGRVGTERDGKGIPPKVKVVGTADRYADCPTCPTARQTETGERTDIGPMLCTAATASVAKTGRSVWQTGDDGRRSH